MASDFLDFAHTLKHSFFIIIAYPGGYSAWFVFNVLATIDEDTFEYTENLDLGLLS